MNDDKKYTQEELNQKIKETEEEVREFTESRLKKPIIYWIDAGLLIILLVFVLYFGIQGHYIEKEVQVINTCGEKVTNWTGDEIVPGQYLEKDIIINPEAVEEYENARKT